MVEGPILALHEKTPPTWSATQTTLDVGHDGATHAFIIECHMQHWDMVSLNYMLHIILVRTNLQLGSYT